MTAAQAVTLIREAVADTTLTAADPQDAFGARVVPFELRQWLARLRLLEGVPFAYLAADSELLPQESIRFFYLDRAWTDALIEGALSVGTVNSADRAQLAACNRARRARSPASCCGPAPSPAGPACTYGHTPVSRPPATTRSSQNPIRGG
jgi:hypothetical protein